MKGFVNMISRRSFLKVLTGIGINLVVLTSTEWPLKSIGNFFHIDKLNKANLQPSVVSETIITESNHIFQPIDDVKALAGLEMQGRETGSIGEGKAAAYLSDRLGRIGLTPIGESGYEQVFTIPEVNKTFVNGRLVFVPGKKNALRTPSVNLLGKIQGKKENEIILICAHYDHMGIHENKIYPGANDNATGVACILDVLKRLVKEETPNGASIVVAFWSGEEMGFLGSRAFIKSPLFPLSRIKAVLNVDSIGNGNIDDFVYWADTDNIAVKALKTASISTKTKLTSAFKRGHNSDQSSFASVGIPAVTLLSKDWLVKNHTTTDITQFVKPEKISKASDIIYRAIKLLS